MRDIVQSMREECLAMLSGRFVPYHALSWIVAVGTTLVFSALMSHAVPYEARLAVVDADGSKFSSELVQSLNTSPYIEVTDVFRNAVDPGPLLQHDRNVSVLYIPKGLEKAVARNDGSFNVGLFADFSNIAQNGYMSSALAEDAPLAATLIRERLPGSAETGRSGVGVVERRVFNPTASSTTVFTITFIFFFSSIFYGIAVLMVIGRLKLTGMWRTCVLPRGPAAFMARIIPYAVCYTTAVTAMTAVLALFGQLPFAGNFLWYAPVVPMTALGIGLLGYIITWNTENPSQGSGRMILVVPPGFIMGGALLTSGFFNPDLAAVKWIWPLSWQYSLWRDFALRGAEASEMAGRYGAFILYLTALAAVVTVLFWRAARREAASAASVRSASG